MRMEAVMIMDKSGSMAGLWSDATGTLRKLVSDLKAMKDEVLFTLVLFDTVYTTLFDGVPIKDVDLETTCLPMPSGMTALLDSVGKTIDTLGQRLATSGVYTDKVAINILSDGAENASKEYTLNTVKEKIKHQEEKYGWSFCFVGAGLDAYNEGVSLGVHDSSNVARSAKGLKLAYKSFSRNYTVHK